MPKPNYVCNPTLRRSFMLAMGDEATEFRLRAAHCRELAKTARDEVSCRELNNIADELDAEADRIDAENNQPPMPMPPTS